MAEASYCLHYLHVNYQVLLTHVEGVCNSVIHTMYNSSKVPSLIVDIFSIIWRLHYLHVGGLAPTTTVVLVQLLQGLACCNY